MHIGRMKTVVKAMLGIVVVDTENRHARSTGRSDECWVADAARDIAVRVPCSEARYLVPDERGFEGGNFAVVDGMHSVSSLHIDLTPKAGRPRYSHLLRIGQMGALMQYCAQGPPSLDRRLLAPLGKHLMVRDSVGSVGCPLTIDWFGQAQW